MITPTKGIAPQRALLTVGAQIAQVLDEPMTVSQVWSRFARWRTSNGHNAAVSFSWFVLALDTLYALGAIRLEAGLIVRSVE
ncbi:ABC-three component system middle component 6 [Ruania alba]|uniref:Uncharacterized protein n=1 Tax=Ruania alba TaxID=648782 RepID=A0A1H5L372_9MICO|nr:ABC-three component system middle component 6 [Ruania alba]SEE70678.1 hypothetical protein SAMN04488554_2557 [Ruania alba]